MMDRRRFVVTSLAGALGEPLAAEAQPAATLSRIGVLSDLAWEPLREGLRNLGYVGGRNIIFELRQALGRLSAKHVQRVLLGTNPGDMPIDQLDKPHFIINLRTAKTLGLTIPRSVLARADQVIE